MKKRVGKLKKLTQQLLQAKLTRLPLIVLIGASLGGCMINTIETSKLSTVCTPWRALTYSAKGDTPATVKGIQVHNETGRILHCW